MEFLSQWRLWVALAVALVIAVAVFVLGDEQWGWNLAVAIVVAFIVCWALVVALSLFLAQIPDSDESTAGDERATLRIE